MIKNKREGKRAEYPPMLLSYRGWGGGRDNCDEAIRCHKLEGQVKVDMTTARTENENILSHNILAVVSRLPVFLIINPLR